MAIDTWQIPVKSNQRIKKDIAALRNGAELNLTRLDTKVEDLQEQVSTLVHVVNELVGIIKDEVKDPIKKKQLPPPPGIF